MQNDRSGLINFEEKTPSSEPLFKMNLVWYFQFLKEAL